MSLDPDARLSCPPDVLSRVIEGEAVLLHLGSGMYFGTNEAATVAWERIVSGATVSEIVASLVEEFEVDEATANADLERFVSMLVGAKLCRVESKR